MSTLSTFIKQYGSCSHDHIRLPLPDGAKKVLPNIGCLIKNMTPQKITHTEWMNSLTKWAESAVRAGLFGTKSVDHVIKCIFNEVKMGWCLGFTECLSVDVKHMSVQKAVKKNLECPDRPCFVQICNLLKWALESHTEDKKLLHELFNEACKGKNLHLNAPPFVCQAYEEAKDFCKKHHIRRSDDPRFRKEKSKLFAKYNKLSFPSLRHLTVNSKEKYSKALHLSKEIKKIKDKILGRATPKCSYEVKGRTLAWHRGFPNKKKGRIREVREYIPAHVRSFFPHGDKKCYSFDIGYGLLKYDESLEHKLRREACDPRYEPSFKVFTSKR